MDKTQQLTELKEELEKDKSLQLRQTATQLVFGEGNPDSEIYLLGEAPGYWEDKKGRPFVGAAGQLLDETLSKIGLKRQDIYISNVVRFRPPENRDPTPEEIAAFSPYVDKEIEIIKPKIIITLGRFSMAKFIPNEKISKIHGKVFPLTWHDLEIKVIPMFHPAAALRSPAVMSEFKEDFEVIPKILAGNKSSTPAQLSLI